MTQRKKLHEAIMFATERHAGKSDQCDYYSDGLDALEEMQYHENTRDAYWEATELFNLTFLNSDPEEE